jgi:hypothetical protein
MLIVVSACLPSVLCTPTTLFGPATAYQEDFFTPGSLPSFANDRKQIRHIPN